MASTKKNAAFLVFLAVFALLTSETSSHLRVGKKAFVPLQNELEELFKNRRKISFAENRGKFNQRDNWRLGTEELREFYRE